MIRVTVTDSLLLVQGHAADAGEELTPEKREACAAVTALVQTLANALSCMNQAWRLVMAPGFASIGTADLDHDGSVLLSAILAGLQGQADIYPDSVKLKNLSDRALMS